MISINYLTDDPARLYAKAIRKTSDLYELIQVLHDWEEIAGDALTTARKMSDDDWPEFVAGLKMESRKEFAGVTWVEKYGAILMPKIMMKLSLLSEQMKVPWGTCYIRWKKTKTDK